MNTIDKYLNKILSEDYHSTITKRSRKQKINSSAGVIGVSLARQKNDPLYKRMIYYKHMYIKTKEQLEKKYKSKSMSLARKRAAHF